MTWKMGPVPFFAKLLNLIRDCCSLNHQGVWIIHVPALCFDAHVGSPGLARFMSEGGSRCSPSTQEENRSHRGASLSRQGVVPPRLMTQVREALRTWHYIPRAEESYVTWIKRFIFFHVSGMMSARLLLCIDVQYWRWSGSYRTLGKEVDIFIVSQERA